MQRNYCYLCGSKVKEESKSILWCENCNQRFYLNPKPCVELVLFNDKGEVLLAERGGDPNKGKFDLPGGFMDLDETAEEALTREMKEELNLGPHSFTKPEYFLSTINLYPWYKETYQNVILEFVATLKSDQVVSAQDDVASVRFVLPSQIDPSSVVSERELGVIAEAEKFLKKPTLYLHKGRKQVHGA